MEGWSVGILRGVVFLPSSVHHRVGLSAVVRSEGYAPLGSVWTKAEGALYSAWQFYRSPTPGKRGSPRY
jgi:hypothetical protein